MTRKHFRALEERLSYLKPTPSYSEHDDYHGRFDMWTDCIEEIMDFCFEMNNKFDRVKFKKACGWYE